MSRFLNLEQDLGTLFITINWETISFEIEYKYYKSEIILITIYYLQNEYMPLIPSILLILAGFGNLSGRIEVWDAQGRKQLGTTEAPCTTLLEWSPTGLVFVTATTAPRLRMSNG